MEQNSTSRFVMTKAKRILQKEYTEYQDKRIKLDQPRVYKGPIKVGMLVTGQDNSRFRVVDQRGTVITLKPTSNPGDVVIFPDDFKEVSGLDNFWDYFILEKILENIHMKRSDLVKVVKEVMQGYSPQVGKTKGGTSDDFMRILTTIAKQGQIEDDSEEAKAERGNAILDKASPENIDRITRGEKPMYEGEGTQTYTVYFSVGEDGDDDVKVSASSPEEAINKVKSGEVKLAYGQPLPRLARGFSAKLVNK